MKFPTLLSEIPTLGALLVPKHIPFIRALMSCCKNKRLLLIQAQSTCSDAENHLVEHKPEGALTHFHLIAQFEGGGGGGSTIRWARPWNSNSEWHVKLCEQYELLSVNIATEQIHSAVFIFNVNSENRKETQNCVFVSTHFIRNIFGSDKCLEITGTDAHKSVRASSATVFVVWCESAENLLHSRFHHRTVRNKFHENSFSSSFVVHCLQTKRQSGLDSGSSRLNRRL